MNSSAIMCMQLRSCTCMDEMEQIRAYVCVSLTVSLSHIAANLRLTWQVQLSTYSLSNASQYAHVIYRGLGPS